MITRVQVKNFRNLGDIDVQLGPLTVLVGRNGTGKSTFLDVLRFVRDALRLGLSTAINQRGGLYALCSWSPNGPTSDIEISLEIEESEQKVRYSFAIGVNQAGMLQVKHEFLELTLSSQQPVVKFETRGGKWVIQSLDYLVNHAHLINIPVADSLMLSKLSVLEDLQAIQDTLTATNFYAVFPNTLREPQRQTSESALLEDGQNLAVILRGIIRQKSFYADLMAALKCVVAGVRDIRVQEVGGYLVTELKHEMQNSQETWFPLAQESDGTLRVLGLLTALYQGVPHSLIAIEEPELSVHPGALAMLSEVIEEAATRSQIIITTQSPDLISRFKADQLRIVERVGTETFIGPIEEGQQEAINAQLFSAGDLLRIEGLHISTQEEPVNYYA
ncbi:MAG: AAA family ATPase [Janthinobacterium lividum]